MPVRVYTASITGNTEVRKQIQRVVMVLEGCGIPFDNIDITEPGHQTDREFMQANGQAQGNYKVPLPPQIFHDDAYCGGYDGFDAAVESNSLREFLHLATDAGTAGGQAVVAQTNGHVADDAEHAENVHVDEQLADVAEEEAQAEDEAEAEADDVADEQQTSAGALDASEDADAGDREQGDDQADAEVKHDDTQNDTGDQDEQADADADTNAAHGHAADGDEHGDDVQPHGDDPVDANQAEEEEELETEDVEK